MVSDEKYREKLRDYKRMTNMDTQALKRFKNSPGWEEYAKRKGGLPAREAYQLNLMLQTKIESGRISKKDYPELKKAVSYLSRAKAEYRMEGAGDNKVPNTNTTYRVFALRNWSYDPYETYT